MSDKFYKDERHLIVMARKFHVVIDKDEDGWYVGSVPEIPGCLTQGKSMPELMRNIKDAIQLCLDVEKEHGCIRFLDIKEIKV